MPDPGWQYLWARYNGKFFIRGRNGTTGGSQNKFITKKSRPFPCRYYDSSGYENRIYDSSDEMDFYFIYFLFQLLSTAMAQPSDGGKPFLPGPIHCGVL